MTRDVYAIKILLIYILNYQMWEIFYERDYTGINYGYSSEIVSDWICIHLANWFYLMKSENKLSIFRVNLCKNLAFIKTLL